MNESIYQGMTAAVDDELGQQLLALEIEPRLKDAAMYMLYPGGKRFRPKLLLSICLDLGGKFESAVSLAAAVELLHVSSLIHDDLPALDNDDYRRGRLSCHRAFDEASAVLTGDALIALSFAAASCYQGQNKSGVTSVLFEAFINLCAGQVRDLQVPGDDAAILSMFDQKTGHLLGACAALGALAAACSDSTIKAFYLWGRELGIAFQIADDFKDRFGTSTDRGRPESSDVRNQKAGLFRNHSKGQIQELLRARVCTLEAEFIRLIKGNLNKGSIVSLELIQSQFVAYTGQP